MKTNGNIFSTTSNSFLVILLLAFTFTTACQKPTTSDEAAVSTTLSSDVACADLSASASSDQLKINGATTAQAGKPVVYQLNKKVCSGSEKIDWNLGGSKQVQTADSVIVSNFAAPGNYVVSAKILNSTATQKTIIVSKAPALNGPQVVQINASSNFELVLPEGFTVASAIWNFGDGTANGSGNGPVSHAYTAKGIFNLQVAVRDGNNTLYNLSQSINVFTDDTQLACASQASISSPTEVNINSPITISGIIPTCMQGDLTGFIFNYGDGTTGKNLSADHTYSALGTYEVSLNISTFFQESPDVPYLRLSQTIQVIDPAQNCPALGVSRTNYTDSFSQTATCGLDGTKTQVYKTKITEQCLSNQGTLSWTETSRVNELQSEGACEGQSCRLSDNSILANGSSKVFYSSVNAAGLCSAVSSTRTCNNGVLSGSDTFSNLVCHDGCGDFGPNGTVKTNVITGETQTALVCQFNETGFFNTYNQVSDKKCVDGQIITSNTHQGDLKSADVCPSYHWQGTETWSTCSANCGGQQQRTFVCQDNKNQTAPDERCTAIKPSESRVCDGDPAAAGHIDRATAEEDGGSSAICPKNQIGIISKTRTATTVKTYACLDHAVQLSEQHIEYSAWVTETYCRDYVAYRCSQDSLDNTHAVERYKWMLKCESTVPVIKEFLDNFSNVKGSNKYTIDAKARVLYPTFMVHSEGKEKVWIAPTSSQANCTVPVNAYVAAVCVSSCATPEQQILVEANAHLQKMKYTSFIDALTQKMAKVGTLTTDSNIHTKTVKATEVDQWVTEMLDTEHVILEFHMKSGRSLRLTPNHPVVSEDGSIHLAETFKAGDNLVQLGGDLDPIVSINETKYFGKVYNLFVKSADPLHNIVVTNGYLNGTAFFQNEGSSNINRVLLQKRLTKGVFSK